MLTYGVASEILSEQLSSEWVDEVKHASPPSPTLTPRDPLEPPPAIPEGVSCGPTELATVGEEIVVRSARACCFTAGFSDALLLALLFYRCFTGVLLLLYCCFTAALLLLYCCFTAGSLCGGRSVCVGAPPRTAPLPLSLRSASVGG
jgi:hypothetical protein